MGLNINQAGLCVILSPNQALPLLASSSVFLNVYIKYASSASSSPPRYHLYLERVWTSVYGVKPDKKYGSLPGN